MILNNKNEKFELDLSHFDIVNINEMLTYEKVHKSHVNEIAQDLDKRKVLINPVIYDPKINLLIDGHHRIDAFKLLNYKHIAAFNVDYFSNEVTIENWYRIISGLEMKIFENILHSQLKKFASHHNFFYLVIENCNDIIKQVPFSNSLEASFFLESLCDSVISQGGEVILSPKKEIDQNYNKKLLFLSINPIIDKIQVFNVARSKKSFHFQVNRHLINNRPLGIYLPLEVFHLPKSYAKTKYREHIFQSSQISIEKGRWLDGRFYEENTILFFHKNNDISMSLYNVVKC